MGALLTRFRKKQTTAELLGHIQAKIDSLEKSTFDAANRRKRVLGIFLATAVGVYILAFFVFYFIYFPPTLKERIRLATPLILFPLVIMAVRNLFLLYFQRKLNNNAEKLAALKEEKKKILEQVMDKETYKEAVKILARFGDKSTGLGKPYATTIKESGTVQNTTALKTTMSQSFNAVQPLSAPVIAVKNPWHSMKGPRTSLTFKRTGYVSTNQQLRQRTPFPIVNAKNQSVMDRIVDMIIGDGPQNRYAMICKGCLGHNGMALKEDFEYMAFRCIYCNVLNPARKLKPIAPRLSLKSPYVRPSSAMSSDNSHDESSDSDNANVTVIEMKPGSTDTIAVIKPLLTPDNYNECIISEDKSDNSDNDNNDNTETEPKGEAEPEVKDNANVTVIEMKPGSTDTIAVINPLLTPDNYNECIISEDKSDNSDNDNNDNTETEPKGEAEPEVKDNANVTVIEMKPGSTDTITVIKPLLTPDNYNECIISEDKSDNSDNNNNDNTETEPKGEAEPEVKDNANVTVIEMKPGSTDTITVIKPLLTPDNYNECIISEDKSDNSDNNNNDNTETEPKGEAEPEVKGIDKIADSYTDSHNNNTTAHLDQIYVINDNDNDEDDTDMNDVTLIPSPDKME